MKDKAPATKSAGKDARADEVLDRKEVAKDAKKVKEAWKGHQVDPLTRTAGRIEGRLGAAVPGLMGSSNVQLGPAIQGWLPAIRPAGGGLY